MSTARISDPSEPAFDAGLLEFMRELRANNDREWFAANRARYEAQVREPALAFIEDFAPHLAEISAHFVADPRPSGGSMFRIHRDVRFARDKSPYKTHVGIHFRHERSRDAHAPGFYLHLEPGACMCAAGIWRPDRDTLGRIRAAIAADPDGWRAATAGRGMELEGEALKRPPAGYAADHALIEDLKRKDFAASRPLSDAEVTGPGFIERYAGACADATPFVGFLCRAVGVPC
jgi:uncharacterized protein (TIGR02453 family)